MNDWLNEKVIGGIAAVFVAAFAAWRIAKKLRVNINTGNDVDHGDADVKGGHNTGNNLLASIDGSLKTLVQGQQEAFKKLDRIQEAAESVRRELAEVKGSLFGRQL